MGTIDIADRLGVAVKAYDVRGRFPGVLDEGVYRLLGAGFAEHVGTGNAEGIVVGHDMRDSSPAAAHAFAEGAAQRGVDALLIGLCSTDGLYFAAGSLDRPGAMVTASHNPAGDNGLKLCRAGAAPISMQTGLGAIRDLAITYASSGIPSGAELGTISDRSMLGDYADHLQSLVPLGGGRDLAVVVDAGNGMAGLTVPEVLTHPSLSIDPLYFELDGTFPNHPANPLDTSTLVDLQERVATTDADLGLAFDGDADRCVVVDENGRLVDPSALTAMIAARELRTHPGGLIIYNVICSRAVPEVVGELGGTAVRSRVGHSFIKGLMAETGAVFAGEHSGHYYFQDFWRADSGLLAALHVLDELQRAAVPLSELISPFDRYVSTGEINNHVSDMAAATERVRSAFEAESGVSVDELDGLTVSHANWWFNLRPSNTEPLLRLNAEAVDTDTMSTVRDRVLAILTQGAD